MHKPNIKQDNRANSLKLNPRPRQTSGFNTFAIQPPTSDAMRMEFERVQQVVKHLGLK
jgi:hypothetical protein